MRNKTRTLLAALIGMTFVSVAYAASIDEVRMWRAPDHIRLVFDLSAAIDYSMFMLDDPRRVVIDIKDSEFNDDF